MPLAASYLKKLQQRAKDSHVYRKYQLLGLEVAHILDDEKHKALYIKLAKERGGDKMMQLAKEVAERRGIKNKGAYFMKVLASEFAAAPMPPKKIAHNA
jgi:hypothetical protein